VSFCLDTNILIYSVDDRDRLKQDVARRVVYRAVETNSILGLQVVGEYQNALKRRMKLSPEHAAMAAAFILKSFDTFAYDRDAVTRALEAARAYRFSYWDALLLASAEKSGVTALLSEDMHDGGAFGRVEIVNPFAADGMSHRAQTLLGL
jgi:predicted nucleic acid-binding protein